MKPALVISLDFELHWGMRDRRSLEEYGENIAGVWQAVPAMLQLFGKHGIHATWATVGFLFCRNRKQLLASVPKQLPRYVNAALSPYPHLGNIGHNEVDDPYHFAFPLLEQIRNQAGQEVGSHTFSHYYCLERGQTPSEFAADLAAAQNIAGEIGISLKSMVFPRNQYSAPYVQACEKAGMAAYRGTESSWLYQARSRERESLARRALRLADAYIPLSGHNTYTWQSLKPGRGRQIANIPSSRFLRPCSPRLKPLESIRFRRIANGMTHAAENGRLFHLWWHPHNFGKHLDDNLRFLEKILQHFGQLQQKYGMESLNMAEAADKALQSP